MKPKLEKPKYYDIDPSNLHVGKRIRSSDQTKANLAVKRSSNVGQDQPDKKRPKPSKEIPKKNKADHQSKPAAMSSLFDALNNEMIDLNLGKNDTVTKKSKNGAENLAKEKDRAVVVNKNLPKKLTDCGIDFGGMSSDRSKYHDKKKDKKNKDDDKNRKKHKKNKHKHEKRHKKDEKSSKRSHDDDHHRQKKDKKKKSHKENRDKESRETKKAISHGSEGKTVEAKLEEMFNDPSPQKVRFNDQLEIVQYDEDETVTSFQEYLQNSPNIATTSTQSVSRNFVSSDNENSNMSATSKLAAKKDILNEAAIYQSISRKNVAKLVAEDILDKAICKAIPYEKRWYCPLCARFDATDGVLNEQEVRSHIIRKHAEVQDAFFKFSAETWASIIINH